MKKLRLVIPYPPGVNAMWRSWAGKVLLSARGRAYREEGLRQLEGHVGVRFLDGEKVRVRIEMWPPDRRRRDVDGPLKASLDLLTHAQIWTDDHQVDELTIIRKPKFAGGRLIVTITELEQQQENAA